MLTNIKSKFLRSIKNKRLNVFGLFLLIAFMILVLSKLSNTYTEHLSVAINYANIPKNKVLTLDEKPKLDVVVSTYGFKILTYYLFETPVLVDLKKHAHIKNSSYIWVANRAMPSIEKQFGTSVKIISVQPDTLKFPFDTLTVKTVPIHFDYEVSFASGYDSYEGFTFVPDSINIYGAQEEVSNVDHIETAKFIMNDIKSDVKKSVVLKLPEASKSLKLSQQQTVVSAYVEKFTEGNVEIPITIKNLPNGIKINYFPKTIKVSYEVSLQNYNDIKPKDFRIECDFSDVYQTDKTFFSPKLISKPEKVKSVKMKQNKIEYIIIQ